MVAEPARPRRPAPLHGDDRAATLRTAVCRHAVYATHQQHRRPRHHATLPQLRHMDSCLYRYHLQPGGVGKPLGAAPLLSRQSCHSHCPPHLWRRQHSHSPSPAPRAGALRRYAPLLSGRRRERLYPEEKHRRAAPRDSQSEILSAGTRRAGRRLSRHYTLLPPPGPTTAKAAVAAARHYAPDGHHHSAHIHPPQSTRQPLGRQDYHPSPIRSHCTRGKTTAALPAARWQSAAGKAICCCNVQTA